MGTVKGRLPSLGIDYAKEFSPFNNNNNNNNNDDDDNHQELITKDVH